MAYQAIGLGAEPDDGTGDSLRIGADKVNDNFVELYTLLGDASDLSSGISATATVVTLTNPVITGPTISGTVGGTQTSATITTVTSTTVNAGTLVLAAGSVTDSSGAISFGNENLTTTGTFNCSDITATGTLVFADGSIAIVDLDIDGGTDIGAAVVAADLFIVDDGAGGTNRKTAASRIKTFVEASTVAVTGNVTASGTVEPAGDTATGDNAAIGYTSGEGLILTGQGSTSDITIKNDADTTVINIATGTTNVDVVGDLTAGTLNADGDTAASDNAAMGYTSAEGLILTGQGSTSDITIKNDADADVITVATGTTNVDVVGDLTAGTLNADGDTAAGDNAAIGYTSGEGLILTGQGSTNDVTIKNDADADVIKIPTGTTNVTIVGNLTTATGGIATASLANNAVTLAKMAGGIDGNIISYDASGDPVAIVTGSDGQVLTSTGAGSPPAFADTLTLATEQATTSGDAITFSSIPSGTKIIYIMFTGVSTDDWTHLKIQIGDSGGLETSGYLGGSGSIIATAASAKAVTGSFIMSGAGGTYGAAAANNYHGTAILTLEDSSNNTWTMMSVTASQTTEAEFGAGSKSLSGELTQLAFQSGRASAPSGAEFDAGAVNIMYS